MIPERESNTFRVWTFLSGENAESVWDSAVLRSATDVKFSLDSAELRNEVFDRKKLLRPPWGDDGTLLGYDQLDGELNPGYKYSGTVEFRVRVS